MFGCTLETHILDIQQIEATLLLDFESNHANWVEVSNNLSKVLYLSICQWYAMWATAELNITVIHITSINLLSFHH